MLVFKNIHLAFEKELIKDGSFSVEVGKMTVISGESGSGKSSLLYDIAFMSRNASMDYWFCGQNVNQLDEKEKRELMRTQISFVFQNVLLIDHMNLIDNLKFNAELAGHVFDKELAYQYLEDLNLYLDEKSDVSLLSGGERQRLAIVCALMKGSSLLIFDEPTAFLDEDNKKHFLVMLDILKNKYKKMILVASHDESLKLCSDYLYEISDQRIQCLKSPQDFIAEENLDYPQIKYQNVKKTLRMFLKSELRKNKWRVKMTQVFMVVVMALACVSITFMVFYGGQLNKRIDELKSTQIVIDMYGQYPEDKIRNLYRVDGVKELRKINYIEMDNAYLICPYTSEDYFQNHQLKETISQNSVFANYEVYRQNKDNIVTYKVGEVEKEIAIDVYLDATFEDYRFYSRTVKVIYVPFAFFDEMKVNFESSLFQTTAYIIKIDSPDNYEVVLKELYSQFPDASLVGNSSLEKMLKVNATFEVLSSYIFKIILVVFAILFFCIKVSDAYLSRFAYVLLEINGIGYRDIYRLIFEAEKNIFIKPMLIVCLFTNSLFLFYGLWNLQVLIWISLFCCVVMLFVLLYSLSLSFIMKKVFSMQTIIKKSF